MHSLWMDMIRRRIGDGILFSHDSTGMGSSNAGSSNAGVETGKPDESRLSKGVTKLMDVFGQFRLYPHCGAEVREMMGCAPSDAVSRKGSSFRKPPRVWLKNEGISQPKSESEMRSRRCVPIVTVVWYPAKQERGS